MDFLNYAKEDIHWWSTWFNQFVLCLAVLAFRQTANSEIDITTSVIEVFSKHAFGLYLIRQLYFNSKFQFKFKTKCVLVITLLINIALILRYHILEKKGANWWSTIVLRDIVLYFIIFIQMGFEYKSWDNKILKWRESLVLDQRFANNDESETFIRKNIDSMIEQIVEVDGKLDLSKIDEPFATFASISTVYVADVELPADKVPKSHVMTPPAWLHVAEEANVTPDGSVSFTVTF